MQKIILRPLPGKLVWSVSGETPEQELHELEDYLQPGALAHLPPADTVCLLLSPEYLCFRQAELPAANYKITPQTLSWLVEDSVAGNADDLLWTVLGREENTLHLVGIARRALAEMLAAFSVAGVTLSHIVPDGFWLPDVANGWCLCQEETRWLIRYDAWKTGVLDGALLSHLLTTCPETPVMSLSPLPVAHARIEYSQAHPHWYDADRLPAVNLIQGAFRPARPVRQAPRVLKYGTTFMLGLAAVLFFSLKGLTLWQLHQQKQALVSEGRALWGRYFPGDDRSNNFKFFFASSVKSRHPDVLTLLTQLQEKLQPWPGLTLRQVSYGLDTHRFEAIINANDAGQLSGFMAQAAGTYTVLPQPDGVKLSLKERK